MKSIIFFVCLFFPFISFCQLDESLQLSGKSWAELQSPAESVPFGALLSLSFGAFGLEKKVSLAVEESVLCRKYKGKASSAFFCRMEDRLEHKVRFPVRMRLGTLDYVDRLEQKRADVPQVNY